MRSFAIVPAAGQSRRMGRPKLLLPWRSTSVLQCVLHTWTGSDVERTILVVRAGDEPLCAVGRRCGVELVMAEPPPAEMKDSIRAGLEHVQSRYAPDELAWWLVSPADNPRLSRAVVNRVCRVCATTRADIVVPQYAGRRGHPVAFRWHLAAEVSRLPPCEGVNALLCRHAIEVCAVDDPGILTDLDTPEDYRRES